MAVTKRTRFEVLRRDNYTCRYCRSTDGTLTVDHVTPVALGGTDDPDNLVAACRDCNAGKASSSPDEGTVAQVKDDAIRWAAAMARAAAEVKGDRGAHADDLDWFEKTWRAVTVGAHLSHNWRGTVRNYLSAGLDREDLEDAMNAAVGGVSPYSPHRHFPYFCGVCRNKATKIRERAEQILAEETETNA